MNIWKKGDWFVRVIREEDGFGPNSAGRTGAIQVEDVQTVGSPALWNGQRPFWINSMQLERATDNEIRLARDERAESAEMIERGERMCQILSAGEFAADHEWVDGKWAEV